MMASHLVRATRIVPRVGQRAIATTANRQKDISDLPANKREEAFPKLGNRDIVGFGWNGQPTYIDRSDFPFPAVRYQENTPEVLALREKEKGDWKNLTMEEKKALYRASFRQTFAEVNAPTGEWKAVLAGLLLVISVTGWFMIWARKYVYPPLPSTITKEWQEQQLDLMIKQRQGAIEGLGSKFDYEKNTWK